jgi:hypothetical protein
MVVDSAGSVFDALRGAVDRAENYAAGLALEQYTVPEPEADQLRAALAAEAASYTALQEDRDALRVQVQHLQVRLGAANEYIGWLESLQPPEAGS